MKPSSQSEQSTSPQNSSQRPEPAGQGNNKRFRQQLKQNYNHHVNNNIEKGSTDMNKQIVSGRQQMVMENSEEVEVDNFPLNA